MIALYPESADALSNLGSILIQAEALEKAETSSHFGTARPSLAMRQRAHARSRARPSTGHTRSSSTECQTHPANLVLRAFEDAACN